MALTMVTPVLTAPKPDAAGLRATKLSEESRAADELAAAFLAEMLSFAGLDNAISAQTGFGGEAMSGFLLQEYSEKIINRGGFGISAMILSHMNRAGIANDK